MQTAATYIVQVNTSNPQDGCCQRVFTGLGDDVRNFIKSSASMLRAGNATLKCTATILRNGTTLAQARVLNC